MDTDAAVVVHPAAYQERHLIEFCRRDLRDKGEAVTDPIEIRDVMSYYRIRDDRGPEDVQRQIHELFASRYPGAGPREIVADLESPLDLDDEERSDLVVSVLGSAVLNQDVAGRADSDVVQMLELHFGVPATESSEVSPGLYAAMRSHYGCDDGCGGQLLEDAIPGYAALLEARELERNRRELDGRIESYKEEAEREHGREIAERERELKRRILSARADVARSRLAKHADLKDRMMALMDDTFKA